MGERRRKLGWTRMMTRPCNSCQGRGTGSGGLQLGQALVVYHNITEALRQRGRRNEEHFTCTCMIAPFVVGFLVIQRDSVMLFKRFNSLHTMTLPMPPGFTQYSSGSVFTNLTR